MRPYPPQQTENCPTSATASIPIRPARLAWGLKAVAESLKRAAGATNPPRMVILRYEPAKPVDGPYQQGKRSQIKVKHKRTADVVVAGGSEEPPTSNRTRC